MSDRIVLSCVTCDEGVDVPDKGLGRAVAAAWRTRLQGHDVTEGPAPAASPAEDERS